MSDGPSQLVLDPRDERLIHRLEAFSAFVTLIVERIAVPRMLARDAR
ncbi:MAG: hypothetical protein M3R30_08445 [Candidatus Eremiobacteraeota bacterium]|nr:hypothetical protein [Candidatus Eremiobacteraeota bacterium]